MGGGFPKRSATLSDLGIPEVFVFTPRINRSRKGIYNILFNPNTISHSSLLFFSRLEFDTSSEIDFARKRHPGQVFPRMKRQNPVMHDGLLINELPIKSRGKS